MYDQAWELSSMCYYYTNKDFSSQRQYIQDINFDTTLTAIYAYQFFSVHQLQNCSTIMFSNTIHNNNYPQIYIAMYDAIGLCTVQVAYPLLLVQCLQDC